MTGRVLDGYIEASRVKPLTDFCVKLSLTPEDLIKEWRKHDYLLRDLDGFQAFCDKKYEELRREILLPVCEGCRFWLDDEGSCKNHSTPWELNNELPDEFWLKLLNGEVKKCPYKYIRI